MRPDGRPNGPGRPEQARVFFALWPDDRTRAALHRAAVDCARRFGGRPMQMETLHLTLAFIGSVAVDELAALRDAGAAVRGSASVRLELDCLGFWSHNRILWAGSRRTAAGLPELVASLAGELSKRGYSAGLKLDHPFAPHITLVRNVTNKRPDLPDLPPIDWVCESFVLVRSRLSNQGADYQVIDQWPM